MIPLIIVSISNDPAYFLGFFFSQKKIYFGFFFSDLDAEDRIFLRWGYMHSLSEISNQWRLETVCILLWRLKTHRRPKLRKLPPQPPSPPLPHQAPQHHQQTHPSSSPLFPPLFFFFSFYFFLLLFFFLPLSSLFIFSFSPPFL